MVFPRRAVIQVFEREDGSIQMPPDYQPVAAELRRRGTVEVVTQTTEQFLGTNSATAGPVSYTHLTLPTNREV